MSGGISRLEAKPERARPQPSLPVLPSGVAKNPAGRQLWDPADEPKSRRGSRAKRSTARRSRQSNRPRSIGQVGPSEVHPADVSAMPGFSLFRQPETKPITQEQLISEVKDPDPFNDAFVRVHAVIFSLRPTEEIDCAMAKFLDNLDKKIAEKNKEWLRSGYLIAISLICSLLGYGVPNNPIKKELPISKEKPCQDNDNAKKAARNTVDDTAHPKAIAHIEKEFPWARVVDVLNEAYPALMSKPRMANETFPRPPRNEPLRPLPEDYAMRGLEISNKYFPLDWFSSDKLEDEEKRFEPPSLGDERRQRLLWLGRRICSVGNWFEWDEGSSQFLAKKEEDEDSGQYAQDFSRSYQAAISAPVSGLAPGLSKPQSDDFFPHFGQHAYLLGTQDVLSIDLQRLPPLLTTAIRALLP
ncbi:hypothetical protein IF2G_10850 [Cordyceps javanica]|nr:hypothetical protein IF2G_10850 [Cordyceps javanica]